MKNRKKKSVIKRIISLMLVVMMLPLAAFSTLAAPADEEGYANLAVGKSVTATHCDATAANSIYYALTNINDGEWMTVEGANTKLGYNSGFLASETEVVDITMDLGAKYSIDKMVLKPMKWSEGTTFPIDYELQLSADGAEWKTVASEVNKDVSAESNAAVAPQEYTFEETTAQYARIHVTKSPYTAALSAYYFDIGEWEVWGVEAAAEEPEEDPSEEPTETLENLALNKVATSAYNKVEGGYYDIAQLTDGLWTTYPTSIGWNTGDVEQNTVVDVNLDLGAEYLVEKMVLKPAQWSQGAMFPKDFELQVSTDKETWTTVAAEEDADVTANSDAEVEPQEYTFDAVAARYVRIHITENPYMDAGWLQAYYSELGEWEVWGVEKSAEETPDDTKPESYNFAVNQKVESTSTYTAPEGYYDISYINDGKWVGIEGTNMGWISSPYESIAEDTPIDITFTLDSSYALEKIVLKPMKWSWGKTFPRDFELLGSTDGETWTPVYAAQKDVSTEVANNGNCATDSLAVQPLEFVLDEAASIKYFRIHITKNSAEQDASGAYSSAIGEVELYGYDENYVAAEAKINKTALRANPGETDWLEVVVDKFEEAPEVTFKSSNEDVVTVDEDGTVHFIAEGEAVITTTDVTNNVEYTTTVLVDNFKVEDEFQIVTFMPYFWEEEINEEYFDDLKASGITDVELNFALDSNAITYENNLKAIELAYERGLNVTVSEADFTNATWLTKSDEEIIEFVKKYSHLPGVTGYYIEDESAVSWEYADEIALVKSIMPNAVTHVNYCGYYADNVRKLYDELEKYGDDLLDYVMYDVYVYRQEQCNEEAMYSFLEYNRELGEELDTPTACYIQSMNWNAAGLDYNDSYRPNGDDIRYQIWAALAYGVKQYSFFCYHTPRTNIYETYGPAIVDIDGNPTDLFEPVSEINWQVRAIGDTLMKLKTNVVYHTGTKFGESYTELPEDYYLQPVDDSQNLVISCMEDATTGREYAIVVNRDYNNAQTVQFTLSDAVGSVNYISTETGEAVALTPDENGVYTVELQAGEGVLLQMDEEYDYLYVNPNDKTAGVGENAAQANKTDVTVNKGSNKDQLTDGARISNSYTVASGAGLPGYTANVGGGVSIYFDFGADQTLNRMDLYPGKDLTTFPTHFILQGSNDSGEDKTWETILEETEYKIPENQAAVFEFEEVTYKYVRLQVKETASGKLNLCEVELYNDDGTVADPEPLNGAQEVDPDLQPADNLARQAGVTLICSDTYEEGPYWLAKNINDGLSFDLSASGSVGWSSGQSRGTAAEKDCWVGYDLGSLKNINKVVAYNAWEEHDGRGAENWPSDYQIQVSKDNENWTTVYSVVNDQNWEEIGARVMEFDDVTARYVRFNATRLSRCAYAFMLQLGELEVYGTDYTGPALELYDEAKAEIEAYRATKADADYRDAQVEELDAAAEAGIAAVEAATTEEEIDAAVAAAKASMDAVKTDAQLKEEENPSGGEDDKDQPSGGEDDKDQPSGGEDDKDQPSGGEDDKDQPSGGEDDKDQPSDGKDEPSGDKDTGKNENASVNTGDSSNIAGYLALLCAAVLGFVVILFTKKRREA